MFKKKIIQDPFEEFQEEREEVALAPDTGNIDQHPIIEVVPPIPRNHVGRPTKEQSKILSEARQLKEAVHRNHCNHKVYMSITVSMPTINSTS